MKKFLSKDKVIAAAIATLTSTSVNASLPQSVQLENNIKNLEIAVSEKSIGVNGALTLHKQPSSMAQQESLHAYHSSHSSHGSHQSHSSHYSSRY